MSAIDDLRTQIVNSNLALKALIQDIQQCQGPMDQLVDLNTQGREYIASLKNSIRLMKGLKDEVLQSNDLKALELEIKSMEDELRVTMAAFKEAHVASMINIEKAEREELLGKDNESLLRHRKKKDKEDLVRMSSNVTERLLSISRTLSESTQRSAESLGVLATSSGTLDSTRGELDSQGSVIGQSEKLLAKYGRRELTDKVLILFAFAFFFACVFYILYKRLYYS